MNIHLQFLSVWSVLTTLFANHCTRVDLSEEKYRHVVKDQE
jgi:hypothetical protein